jgi:MraZ protein
MPEWNVIIEDLYKKLSPLKVKHQNYLRTFTSDAETVQCDKNGRITIPKYLRKFANIDKNVTFIGMVNKIEIWNSETYANHRPSHLSPGDKYYDDIKE